MPFGPFVTRELITLSRRRGTFAGRSALVAVVLAVMGACDFARWWMGLDRSSVAGMAASTLQAFGFIVFLQGIVTWILVPSEVAPAIAAERERKSLDALLSSRLSSAEIVLGLTASGLVKSMSGLAVVVPVLLLLVATAGLDPRLVLLSYAGLASMTFAVAAISAAASLGARDRQRALGRAVSVCMMWLFLPPMLILWLPKFWPWGARWAVPSALRILESSPLGVVWNLVGMFRRGTPLEAVVRMIGLQMAGGTLLLLWAVVRLRPACRAVYDGEGRLLWLRRTRPTRRKPWPPCGNDPVLWREMYGSRVPGPLERWIGRLMGLALGAGLAVTTYWFAAPAFGELAGSGYGAASDRVAFPDVSPLAMALVRGLSEGPPPGTARMEFNVVVRQLTAFWALIYVLTIAGLAAGTIQGERSRDTWSGLLATPLTGREILRAKMLGVVWKARDWLTLPVAVWTLGLLSGAIHPLGYLLALAWLGVSTWFLVALGTCASLRARDARQATGRVTVPVSCLLFSALLLFLLPRASRSILLGAGSMPLLGDLSLVTFEEVRVAFRTGSFPRLDAIGIGTGEGVARVATTYLLGLAGQAIAAYLLTRSAVLGFDAAVGRPVRSAAVGLAPRDGPQARPVCATAAPFTRSWSR